MEYWGARYASGTDSGRTVTWEWQTIDRLVGQIDDVIDVGCGDLSFWKGRSLPARYVGIDISDTMVARNTALWPNARFICSGSQNPVETDSAKVVLCLNVLFHLMDDEDYEKTIANLARYSSEWLLISTWKRNPFAAFRSRLRASAYRLKEWRVGAAMRAMSGTSDGSYQRFRDFQESISALKGRGFELVSSEQAPNPYGALYVFRRVSE